MYNFPIEFLIFKLFSSLFVLQLSFLCLCRLSFDCRKKCKTRGDYERDRAAKNNQQEELQQVQQLSSSVLVEIVGHAVCNVKENKRRKKAVGFLGMQQHYWQPKLLTVC